MLAHKHATTQLHHSDDARVTVVRGWQIHGTILAGPESSSGCGPLNMADDRQSGEVRDLGVFESQDVSAILALQNTRGRTPCSGIETLRF
jgi:hypothetical protein